MCVLPIIKFRTKNEDVLSLPDQTTIELNMQTRLTLSIIYLIDKISETVVMLILMSYNGWGFLMIVLGLAAGYFVFKSEIEVNPIEKKGQNDSGEALNYELTHK